MHKIIFKSHSTGTLYPCITKPNGIQVADKENPLPASYNMSPYEHTGTGKDYEMYWLNESKLPPVTVKSYDGKTDVNVKAMQQSLRIDFPSYARKDIDDWGTPFLTNCVHTETKCGCSIIGNGTLQFPLTIKFCKTHE